MSEKIKTAVMEIIKAHMDGEDKNTKAVLSDVMESVNEILEQQPCDECRNKRTSICGNCKEYDEYEPCDDAISREVARKALQNEIDKIRPPFDGWVGETMASLRAGVRLSRNIIEDLPSVTQKSETVTEFADRCRECGKMRKGHWIYDETIENWRCSKCNETPKTMGYVGTADFMAEHFKFCNHCGAKMESEE